MLRGDLRPYVPLQPPSVFQTTQSHHDPQHLVDNDIHLRGRLLTPQQSPISVARNRGNVAIPPLPTQGERKRAADQRAAASGRAPPEVLAISGRGRAPARCSVARCCSNKFDPTCLALVSAHCPTSHQANDRSGDESTGVTGVTDADEVKMHRILLQTGMTAREVLQHSHTTSAE